MALRRASVWPGDITMTEDHRRCFSYLGITLLVISGALAAQGRLPKYDIAGIWLFDVDTPRAK
jgi:hypothetical protein